MLEKEELEATRRRLNEVSPSFCPAKWLQLTLHLHNGQNHSCHHPKTHRVSKAAIALNPSALHNTAFKKQQRKMMLEGQRPKECDYCWRIEDASKESLSDRHLKSNHFWAKPYLNELAQSHWQEDVDPTFLELNFGNLCNMKCAYCSPHISSSWMDELEKFGPYPLEVTQLNLEHLKKRGQMPWVGPEDQNPYLKAFWKWWPDLRGKLKVLRVTGGEPLLTENTFRLLEDVAQTPPQDLQVGINTNLMVPQKRLQRMIEIVQRITRAQKVAKFTVFTSIDGWGARADYVRHGMRGDYFWASVERVLTDLPEVEVVFMCTFNALSVTSFEPLLQHIQKLRQRFPHLRLDISYLWDPEYLSAKVLTLDYLPQVHRLANVMEVLDFSFYEIEQMRRLSEWMSTPNSEVWLDFKRGDFYDFIVEHDRRRHTDFLKVFPEMRDFFSYCRKLSEARQQRRLAEVE